MFQMTQPTGPLAKIELPAFFAKRSMLKSTLVSILAVEAETPKSFRVELQPEFTRRSACWRCGRSITNEQSLRWGVGPDCAATLGLPWEQAPEDELAFSQENRVKLFLPKSFLTEERIEFLREHLPAQAARPTESDTGPSANITLSDDKLWIACPWVNKRFIDELKQVPGRKYHPDGKLNSFDATEDNLESLVGIATRWGMKVSLDAGAQALQERAREQAAALAEALSGHGATSLTDLKFNHVDIENFDWGLKTTPWQHQAQAILFAATLMGIAVPEIDRD